MIGILIAAVAIAFFVVCTDDREPSPVNDYHPIAHDLAKAERDTQ